MGSRLIQRIINRLKGRKRRNVQTAGDWAPMPAKYKHKSIIEYAEEYGCKSFVETGTYEGDTPHRIKDFFNELHTIELSEELYKKAQKRFENETKIKCYQGNSKDLLRGIIDKLQTKPLFWLDAHFSGGCTAQAEDKETPIIEELTIILEKCKECVILIDDARCFGTFPDYPTIFKLKRFVLKHRPNAEIEVYNDIIRIIFQ